MAKLVLASISLETVTSAAKQTAKAVVTCEKAKATLLVAVKEAASKIGQPLSAKQYDRQFKPALADAFAREVKAGRIAEKTAESYQSKLKTCVLALLCGAASPVAGETFWEFYDRAAEPLAAHKLPDGSPVWERKTGRPAKAKGSKAGKGGGPVGGPTGGDVEGASAGDASKQEGGFNRSPELAAALILAHGNESRAQRLVLALANFSEEFDRWASTILDEDDKTKLEKVARVTRRKAA